MCWRIVPRFFRRIVGGASPNHVRLDVLKDRVGSFATRLVRQRHSGRKNRIGKARSFSAEKPVLTYDAIGEV